MEIDQETRIISSGMAIFIPGNAEHAVANYDAYPLRFIYVFPTDTFQQVEYTFVEGQEE